MSRPVAALRGDADEASGRLVKLSNDTNVRVVEVARGAGARRQRRLSNRRRKSGFGVLPGG